MRRLEAGRLRRFLYVTAGVWMTGCGLSAFSPTLATVPLRTGVARVFTAADTVLLKVEIAETPTQRRIGLSGRDSIPEEAGMLFLFEQEQPAHSGFWMYRTRIPLAIAYLDERGRIVAIREMAPCTRLIGIFCPRYPPGSSFTAALEVNRGFFDRNGVNEGDLVVLDG